LAIHPTGHFFAAGYLDGSVAFWAIDDEDRPLLVRTLDDLDVNVVDGYKLEGFLPGDDTGKKPLKPHSPREPIFKLSWSGYTNSTDPRGGETSLIVLGGQYNGDPSGINVLWLPAFNPPSPPAPVTAPDDSLHPFYRQAMRESLDPLNASFYPTPGLTQDFLLISRENPHFGGTWDPKAILVLFEGEFHARAIEVYQFPPLAFTMRLEDPVSSSEKPERTEDVADALEKDLDSTLQSMCLVDEPQKLVLPPSLWAGPNAMLHASLISVDRIAYEQLCKGQEEDRSTFRLEGGFAFPDEEVLDRIKPSKVSTKRCFFQALT